MAARRLPRSVPKQAGKTKTAIASVFTGPSSCVNAFKRAVNAFGEAVLVNCDLPTEPDTIKIFQKSASLAQNLRIKICGEMNQNPGLGQGPGRMISGESKLSGVGFES